MLEKKIVRTIEAVFDGEAFRPEAPLPLEPNTRVWITLETVEPSPAKPKSSLDTAFSLGVDGPPDWAMNIGAYRYDEEGQDEG